MIAGLAFSLGGYLTSYPMLQLIILETAVWLPAGLWLLDIALERRSLPRMALAGAIFGFGVLAGHPQTFLYIGYLVAAYFVFRVAYLRLPIRFGILAGLILGGAALGISAAHWLPGLQMYRFSPRAGSDLRGGLERRSGLRELLGLLRPNPGQWSPLYVGLIPLTLAAVGVVLWRRAETWFWAGGRPRGAAAVSGRLRSAVSALLSCRPRLRDLPRSGADRAAGELLVGGVGGVRIRGADGAGCDGRRDDGRPTTDDRRRSSPESLVPGSWSCPRSSHLHRSLSGEQRNHPANTTRRRLLRQDADRDAYPERQPAGLAHEQRGAVARRWRVRHRLPDSRYRGERAAYLAAYDRFLAQVPEERWWRMLNVQHLITKRDLPHGALKLVRQDGDLRLYQVFQNATLPWIVHAFKPAPDQDAAIQATGDPALDPFQQVILETPPDPPACAARPGRSRPSW